MKRDVLITQSLLLELLEYDYSSGDLVWKTRPIKYFNSVSKQKQWNSRYAGKKAGGIDKRGAITLKIFDKSISAARAVYLYHYGFIPENRVKYKNGDKTDLSINNLYF